MCGESKNLKDGKQNVGIEPSEAITSEKDDP